VFIAAQNYYKNTSTQAGIPKKERKVTPRTGKIIIFGF